MVSSIHHCNQWNMRCCPCSGWHLVVLADLLSSPVSIGKIYSLFCIMLFTSETGNSSPLRLTSAALSQVQQQHQSQGQGQGQGLDAAALRQQQTPILPADSGGYSCESVAPERLLSC